MMLAAVGMVFTACEGNGGLDEENAGNPSAPKIKLSQQSIKVDFEPNTYTVSVTSPYSWKAESDNEWIVVESKSGIAGTEDLSFKVERNEEEKERKGTITVLNTTYNLATEFYVTQKAFSPTITIEKKELNFKAEGGEQSVKITANFDYNVTYDTDWFTCTKADNSISIKVFASDITSERTAGITIANEKYGISEIIKVVQAEFVPTITIEKKELNFNGEGGEQSVNITANFDYNVTADADWILVEKTDNGVLVATHPHISALARDGQIIINNSNRDMSEIIEVHQDSFEYNFNSQSFKRRSLIMQVTGLNGGACPYVRTAMESVFAKDKYKDTAVHTAIHCATYSPDRTFVIWHEYDKLDLASALGVNSFPTYWVDWVHQNSNRGLNDNIKNIEKYLDEQQNSPAKAGIAASVRTVGNKVNIQASVAAVADGDFYVGAWLLENGLKGTQAGSTNPEHMIHNNVVRIADSHPEGGSNWSYYGHPLGTLSKNTIAEYNFEMELKENWISDNCHVVIFVSYSDSKSKRVEVTNAIETKSLSEVVFFEGID